MDVMKFRPNEKYYCTVKYGGFVSCGGNYSTITKSFKSEDHYLNWCNYMMRNYGAKVLEIKHHSELKINKKREL
tara:strand:- start:720 stop:941 length:222 start_codon:yes stop_codon:yes gene_type:complete